MMKKTRFLVVILVLTVALSLLTVSLAAAGGHQQSGSSDEISADQAGNFPLVTTGTGGGLACPAGTVETTLYFNDFEVDDGGWVESGQGEWERGSITTGVHEFCDTTPRPEPSGPWSGSNVWATNLDGCYQNSGAQSFLSQSFDLSAIPAPIQLSWWNWHEVFGTFDVIRVNVNAATMWEDTSSGATADWISETVDLSSYAGNAAVNVEYDLDVTTVVNRSGWYLDDIAISYCAPLAPPSIAMTKTVGTDPNTCSSTSVIGVNEGDDVYYCYEVRNTGDITLTLHDLDDDQLGPLLSAFPYGLGPGQSVDTVTAGETFSATIMTDTLNVATWTAYNQGPTDVVSATSTALVTVTVDSGPTSVSVSGLAGDTAETSMIWMSGLVALIIGFGLIIRRRFAR
jgi:hypothetical protein